MNLELLNSPELAVFTTRTFARSANSSVTAAFKRLARLRRDNRLLVPLTRGVRANTAH